jgi:excisionase family DNA binding protein
MTTEGKPLAPIYTPETLAERWGCSAKHVRTLILSGELRAFQIGPRLLRVTANALEEFEAGPMLPKPERAPNLATTKKLRTEMRLLRLRAPKRLT